MVAQDYPLAFTARQSADGDRVVPGPMLRAGRPAGSRLRQYGFTTIELLIAMAVVAILVTLALPAYNSTLIRSNRAAAQSFLLDLANREEQYLLDARSYTTTVSDLLAVPAPVAPYYTVTISVPSGSTIANAYTITATPIATSMQKNDGPLTINQDGVKTGSW
jgi:type IV pilus assembly protein PilE